MTKDIPGYEGIYTVTDTGRIFRHFKSGDIKEKRLSQTSKGYLSVVLSKDGVGKYAYVHRVVAEVFIANTEGHTTVDHVDENKTNNNANNLRWCTHAQNIEYYNTNDGRTYQIKMARERKSKLKAYEDLLRKKTAELNTIKKELAAKEAALKKQHEMVVKLAKELSEQTDRKYAGYMDITGMCFGSKEALVDAVGKPVRVNDVLFKSCKQAAAFIVESELALGYARNKETINRELRRYINGTRPSWSMYYRYKIS